MTSDNPAWPELVRAALLGTERLPLPPLADGGLDLLAQVTASKADKQEAALLRAAAIAGTYSRCGMIPPSVESLPAAPVSVPEDWPLCHANTDYLQRILRGEFPFLLPEILTALRGARLRAPEELLPELFDAARRNSACRPLLHQVVGRRGEWLAGLNEEWNFFGASTTQDDWENASSASRVELLRLLRATDPAAALTLLSTTWPQDSAEQRVAGVKELEQGLSAGDETFLEAALSDRRKEVRQKAAELLRCLPESALVQRMIERIEPLLTTRDASSILRKVLPGATLEIALPNQCDAAMERDGVEAKPPEGVGAKSWWLAQMLEAIPAAFWSRRLKQSPEMCIRAAAKSDHQAILLRAWAVSARRHKDAGWTSGLLDYSLNHPNEWPLQHVGIEILPEAQRDKVILKLLKEPTDAAESPLALAVLERCPAPWSEPVGRGILLMLRRHAAGDAIHWSWMQHRELLGARIPVTLAAPAQEGWPEEPALAGWSQIKEILQILEFRAGMLKEIP